MTSRQDFVQKSKPTRLRGACLGEGSWPQKLGWGRGGGLPCAFPMWL